MLFLRAAALCCLCSVITVAEELIQNDLTLTRRAGESVSFSCGGTDQCSSTVVYWYQKKDTRDSFRMLLSIGISNGAINRGYNHPQQNDFSAVKNQGSWALELKTVKDVHSAIYYCSCYKSTHRDRIFGSGAKLYVTDTPVAKPSVTVYQAASSDHLEEKRSLLCVASQMVPPVVKITWKSQKQDGSPLAAPPGDTEQLDIIESDYTASILLIHQQDENSHTYGCSVTHEGGTVEGQIEEGVSQSPPKELPPDTLSTNQTLTEGPSSEHPVSQKQVKLLCLVYTVLITKSLVYCCGVSLLRLIRRSRKHAAD
ncbi:immunoglobulin lambda-1 light chain-like [Simochromis diagramma]|uniref:immunoglobulin lambda-1 light chain-like n=1 Tax=Simochromis diagramma TaxID=43689 RepID=UPI001A7E6D3C|nr:immunoglobulin lambda-1 light chain-like [Simochromis diagramma]